MLWGFFKLHLKIKNFKCTFSGLRPLDSVGPGWGLQMCRFNEFPGDTEAVGLGNHILKNHCLTQEEKIHFGGGGNEVIIRGVNN